MSVTVRTIADDILVSLRQTFDDKKIQHSQVAYWIIVMANRLKSQHIAKRDSGAFLSTFTEVPVILPAVNQNKNIVRGRKHFILPSTIYDFNNDRGIDYIAYESDGSPGCPPKFTKITFSRTTPKKSRVRYMSAYEKPSPKEPYFYRIGDFIYFLGVEQVYVPTVEIGIYMTIDPVTTIDIDAPFDFPDELVSQLKMEVLNLGRFSLLVPEERRNDGASSDQAAPTQKLVSVNQNQQQQPEQ